MDRSTRFGAVAEYPICGRRVRLVELWDDAEMYEQATRTVKVVDTSILVGLDDEARCCGFNRHHEPGWLATNADMSAQHYLYPFVVHRADHRPESSPHWRCMLLLHMRDGQEVFSLLDTMTYDQSTAGPRAERRTASPQVHLPEPRRPEPQASDVDVADEAGAPGGGASASVGVRADLGRVEIRTGTKGRLIASLTRAGEYWVLHTERSSTLRSDYVDGLRALLAAVSPEVTLAGPNTAGIHVGDVNARAGDLYPREVVDGTDGVGRPWNGARYGPGR
jgi:hypothetical protein